MRSTASSAEAWHSISSYLFVGAHKLVRGNNINIPCPVGTTKSAPPTPLTLGPGGPPEWVPGWLDASGTLTPCTRHTGARHRRAGGLGAVVRRRL